MAVVMVGLDWAPRQLKCMSLTGSFGQRLPGEWEVIDNTDQMWVTGFATIGGREVKEPYVKRFLKLIKAKRVRQANEAVRRKSVDS